MPYDREQWDERQRRLENAIANLIPCMNNTKWREVFSAAARHRAPFRAAFVRGTEGGTDSIHSVRASWVGESGLKDPGIGGPCSYREILWIRFPTSIPTRMGPIVQSLDSLISDLEKLGELPLTKTDSYVEIRGYQEPSTPDAP
ncbi:MAG TPA: DUF6678 family protein [Pirellulaceae bacterium]|nr:DUF6678 family protein [Pirellulaceae bacterium]